MEEEITAVPMETAPEAAPPEAPEAAAEPTREEAFRAMVTGEYRDLYEAGLEEARAQGAGESRALKAKLEELAPLLARFTEPEPTDAEAEARETSRREAEAAAVRERWMGEETEARALYPSLSLREELRAPETGQRFAGLLSRGVDVRTAYEVVHRDDILTDAMRRTAEIVRAKTVNDLRSRVDRPNENGVSGAGRLTRTDPARLTRRDREAISRRVLAGERVEF